MKYCLIKNLESMTLGQSLDICQHILHFVLTLFYEKEKDLAQCQKVDIS